MFLCDPEVPVDTNHLERALRAIPLGRRNWLFCWTELGAKHTGIIQSLIATCKLHGVDVYTYLVDVLQRVSQHPAKDVIDLTPRVWKTVSSAARWPWRLVSVMANLMHIKSFEAGGGYKKTSRNAEMAVIPAATARIRRRTHDNGDGIGEKKAG